MSFVECMCMGGGGGHVRSAVYSQHIDDSCTIRLDSTSRDTSVEDILRWPV